MRRYVPLLFIVCSILFIMAAVNTYWIYHTSSNQQVSVTQNKITVYTTLPTQIAAPIASEYEKLNKVKVNFVLVSQKDLLDKIKSNSLPNGQADIILADRDVLQQAADLNKLSAVSSEQEDVVAGTFKDKNNLWTGIWYDPVVFCANKDYLQDAPNIPTTWEKLTLDNNIRIGITDFLASDTSADLFYSLVGHYGEASALNFLRALHPRVLQYAKYLSTPVRMAGMGEVDLSVTMQSEAIKYLNNNYPLVLIYPENGTYFQLTGAGLLQNAPDKTQSVQFMQWLLGDELQLCLQKNGFFFVPTNYSTLAYKTYAGKNLIAFTQNIALSNEQKAALLDAWVKTVRLQ